MVSIISLPRTSPEAQGIPSAAILDFIHALQQHDHPLDAVHSFVLVRHGHVIAEGWWKPYQPQTPHRLYSLSKSFTATAIGLAVAEGLLGVDDPVLNFFPNDAPAQPSANLQAMRVRHLLTMNTGHAADTTDRVFGSRSANWPRAFLSLPVEHQPGSWFAYNTAATYMLSAILTRLTGASLLDYLGGRLFEPLGIAPPTWETGPHGVSLGGTGLYLTTEEIARFGQLLLQDGLWEGRRLLPVGWVAAATQPHSDNSNAPAGPDWMAGYGYQFWRCRHNAYRGDGAFGQFCVVLPQQDAVLAITSGLRDMQAVLDKVWAHLLPAMQGGPLPADPSAHGRLSDKLADLALPLPQPALPGGQEQSPDQGRWSEQRYVLESNDLTLASAVLTFGPERTTLAVGDARGEHTLSIGCAAWLAGTTSLRGAGEEAVAAAGAWTAADCYEVHICYTSGELGPVLRFHFAGGQLRLEVDPNVAWAPPVITTIAGRAA